MQSGRTASEVASRLEAERILAERRAAEEEAARLEAERVKSEQMKVQERVTRLQSERQQARLSKTSEAESKLGILRTGGGREGGNHGMSWGGDLKRDNTISLTSTIQET